MSRVFWVFALIPALWAQEEPDPKWRFSLEWDSHYRHSEENAYAIPFRFPDGFLPPGETTGFLETADAGNHVEVSRITLFADYDIQSNWRVHAKFDVIDLYDRNPTSSDHQVDVDEIWLRWGQEWDPEQVPTGRTFYAKLGKFGKFERQDDRHLVSYGLMATAFNRFEDGGLELGMDWGQYFYAKASYTVGNPVFFRDPNALAADNGSPDRDPFLHPYPDPPIKSGVVLLYDAELEEIKFDSRSEWGVAIGTRLGNALGYRTANILLYHYQRKLREAVNMGGSFYSGDLDLLRGVEELGLVNGLPLKNEDKSETGANVWFTFDEGSLFAQYVDSDIAGLKRSGYEIEAAWVFKLPLVWAFQNRQLFSQITPVVRYSHLDCDFVGNGAIYPAPSVWWDWKKLDYGLVVQLHHRWALFIEMTDNRFFRSGKWETNNEFLATARYRWFSRDNR
ncbi:MAG: hypothetical protein H6510_13340 [Acidobacteria bacterium]|nr:hypothetical protein [Acidobacteriota bacterium]MCB9398791.1 hypothetical protein [Acidobacteriota bacterium]